MDKGEDKGEKKRKKQPVPSPPKKKTQGNYIAGGPGPPSSPSSPALRSALTASSGTVLLAPMHPTLVLPKKSKTAPVDFSLHNHLTEGPWGASTHGPSLYCSTAS